MAKIYSKKKSNFNKLNPKIETINFILSYSKAFKVPIYKGMRFENIIN
tara:strand:+ start:3724 stop:3867 length:144 start_codon:yes stop_codon:yes gene_type:complete